MAGAYPQPVHFGYLSLEIGISAGAMLRALRQLRSAGLIEVDRSVVSSDVPFAKPRITGKGMAVAAGLAASAEEASDTLRRSEAATLSQLLKKRGVAPTRAPAQRAEQSLGTATA